MQLYNKIMLYFWLVVGIVSLIIVSFNSITIGIEKWGMYFSMPIIAFLMFFFKRWMMKRMEKHMKFLESQQSNKE
jgi:flagellar biosynthesis protein FliQ